MNTALNLGGNNITNAATTTTTTLNSTNTNATTVTATNVNSQTTRTAGETYTGGWFRTTGDTGWYNEKWGGGFNMTDNTWIRAYNNKSIYTGGQLQAGTVKSNGRMTAGEYIQVNGIAVAGASCPSNGLLGRDATGGTLSCQSGVWTNGAKKLERTTWSMASGSDYGDICSSYLVNTGLAGQGWIATGSDACTEDTRDCTVDNVRCFAIRLK